MHLPQYARKVGAAAVQVETTEKGQVSSLAWEVTSVDGRQTVPRAECVGACSALLLAKEGGVGNPVIHADASYVVQGHGQLSNRGEASKADVWTGITLASEQQSPTICKVKAHTTP